MNNTFIKEPWLKWAMEIQSIAQSGLTYGKDPYDRERYEQLRDISAEMLSYKTDIPVDKVKELFCNETGYQTPKLDTRAAIFKDGKILLVHENTGAWSLPGGWVDILESIESNTIKEVKEESGLD
ncbi:MAG: NUDIX hydrolase, partial [Clostridium sp.]